VKEWNVLDERNEFGKRVPNSWSSCVERARTENKVIAGTCRRLEEEDDLRT